MSLIQSSSVHDFHPPPAKYYNAFIVLLSQQHTHTQHYCDIVRSTQRGNVISQREHSIWFYVIQYSILCIWMWFNWVNLLVSTPNYRLIKVQITQYDIVTQMEYECWIFKKIGSFTHHLNESWTKIHKQSAVYVCWWCLCGRIQNSRIRSTLSTRNSLNIVLNNFLYVPTTTTTNTNTKEWVVKMNAFFLYF